MVMQISNLPVKSFTEAMSNVSNSNKEALWQLLMITQGSRSVADYAEDSTLLLLTVSVMMRHYTMFFFIKDLKG